MDNRGEEIVKCRLQTARNLGRLVDVSQQARQVGLGCRCEIASRLWDSLLWKYPSSRPQDVIDVTDILQEFRSRQESELFQFQRYVYVRPQCPPAWVGTRFILKLLVLYDRDELQSVVIMPERDPLCGLSSLYRRPLPASLLVELLQMIRVLTPVCTRYVPPLVASLTLLVDELVSTSPFSWEIKDYVGLDSQPAVPVEFSRDDYRELTLRTLFQKLELAAAVADKVGAEFNFPVSAVLQQMTNIMGVVPLAAFSQVPRSTALLH